jgi:proline iminopeptidase
MGLVTSLYAIEHPSAVERLVHLCSLGPDQATYATNDVQAVMLARADPVELERWNDMRQQGMAESDPVTLTKQFMRVICSAQMFDRSALERVPMEACEWPNEWLWRGGREAWQSSFDAWDERARLRSMRAPMLVVHAMEDLIPIEAARDTAATVPEARLFTIDRSGHWPWLERPDVFFPAVDSFLNGEWPEGADLVDE